MAVYIQDIPQLTETSFLPRQEVVIHEISPEYWEVDETHGDHTLKIVFYACGPTQGVYAIYDRETKTYFPWTLVNAFCKTGIHTPAPALYQGAWDECLVALTEGDSVLAPGHSRLGIIVRPITGGPAFKRLATSSVLVEGPV